MTKMSKIAHTLRALRALADESSGATEAERLAAASKYEELLRKTHLDASELELQEEGTRHVRVEFGLQSNSYLIGNIMGRGIGSFTQCKSWVASRSGAVNFLGLASDADFAEWLTRSLVSHVQAEALRFSFEASENETRLYARDVEHFAASAARRIKERLFELAAPAAQGSALVVTRSKMINESFAAMGITLGRSAAIRTRGLEAAGLAGQAAGDRASFARPVNGGAQLRIGK